MSTVRTSIVHVATAIYKLGFIFPRIPGPCCLGTMYISCSSQCCKCMFRSRLGARKPGSNVFWWSPDIGTLSEHNGRTNLRLQLHIAPYHVAWCLNAHESRISLTRGQDSHSFSLFPVWRMEGQPARLRHNLTQDIVVYLKPEASILGHTKSSVGGLEAVRIYTHPEICHNRSVGYRIAQL